MTPAIILSLDPKTNKLGIQTKLNNKASVAVLLEAVKMLIANLPEEEEVRIVPATKIPRMPQ